MEVLFDGRGSAPAGLRDTAAQRLHGALRRFAWLVVRVRVRMSDVNGPRGGLDKRCQVALETATGRTLLVESVAGDWQAALGQAVERAGAAIARVRRRLREIPRVRARRRADLEALPT
jgi:hypothetical protein